MNRDASIVALLVAAVVFADLSYCALAIGNQGLGSIFIGVCSGLVYLLFQALKD